MNSSDTSFAAFANYDDQHIRVYQAYPEAIANPACKAGTFVPPFKMERMTWIKPSFMWMMYRSGWGQKPNQERVLAIDITRGGFERALSNAALTHFSTANHVDKDAWAEQLRNSPNRVQWDPDRDFTLNPLARRAIQIGLAGESVQQYVRDWIVAIEDVTALAHDAHDAAKRGDMQEATRLLPHERPYPLSNALVRRLVPERPSP